MAKILVAEDEMLVRLLIIDTLEDAGHTIVEAADGEAALSMLEAMDDLTLLISDVRMPRIDGYQLALAARRLRPQLKLLFTTGYAKESIPGELADVRVLAKPFDTGELEAIVAGMVEAA